MIVSVGYASFAHDILCWQAHEENFYILSVIPVPFCLHASDILHAFCLAHAAKFLQPDARGFRTLQQIWQKKMSSCMPTLNSFLPFVLLSWRLTGWSGGSYQSATMFPLYACSFLLLCQRLRRSGCPYPRGASPSMLPTANTSRHERVGGLGLFSFAFTLVDFYHNKYLRTASMRGRFSSRWTCQHG